MSMDMVVPVEVVDIRSGEVVRVADLPAAAEYLDYLRRTKSQVSAIQRDLERGLLAVADGRAEWTIHVTGGWLLVCDPPSKTEVYWDCEVLDELFDGGLLPEDRRSDLIEVRVERRGRTRALRAAARAGGVIADVIERAEHRSPAARYAKARRAS